MLSIKIVMVLYIIVPTDFMQLLHLFGIVSFGVVKSYWIVLFPESQHALDNSWC